MVLPLSFSTSIAAAVLTLGSVTGPREACVGEVVHHTFQSEVQNGFGVDSLEDLRGKPVLIEFWGVHCPPCVGSAVPHSLRLQEDYGDDLQVLFVQVHRVGRTEWTDMALRSHWLGGRAMWTDERPVYVPGSFVPKFALLSCDGEVLLRGNPLDMERDIDRAIEVEVDRRREGPEDAPAAVRRAYRDFWRGKRGKALTSLRSLTQREPADSRHTVAWSQDELKVRRALDELTRRTRLDLERVEWMIQNGYAFEARERIEDLDRELRGDAEFEELVGSYRRKLDHDSMKRELEASRVVARLEARLFDEGFLDERAERELERIVRKYEGAQAVARAERFAGLTKNR